jgi:hypothetical protein
MSLSTKETPIQRSKDSDESDPRRELVRRVVESNTFVKSRRLSGLLEYVCDLTLAGRSHELNELHIGEAIFGRSADYDPTIDGIVRTHASRLRQRLDQYFKEEGANESLTIVIPKGRYIPSFEPRDVPSRKAFDAPILSPPVFVEPGGPAKMPPETATVPRRQSLAISVAWLLVIVFAMASFFLWRRLEKLKPIAPPTHPLWSQLFLPGQKTLVVPGDNGLVMWEGIMKQNVSLSEFVRGKYLSEASSTATPEEKLATTLGGRRYTSLVDLEAVKLFTQIAASEGSGIETRFARDVRPDDLRDNDLVLLGAMEANPWLELFQPNMNFLIENNREKKTLSVINRHPRQGEPAQWVSAGPPQNEVYAVIAFLPGLNEKRSVLVMAGTAMSGTECALNFASDDKQLAPWLERARRSDGTLRHFEIVLGTHSMGGDALKPVVLASRFLD